MGATGQGRRKDGTFKVSKRGKFNQAGEWIDGHYFHSGVEGRRYRQLKAMQERGTIRRLELQPKFLIAVNGVPICTYVADFRYQALTPNGSVLATLVEEVKGMETPVYLLKVKLYEALYGKRPYQIDGPIVDKCEGLRAHEIPLRA